MKTKLYFVICIVLVALFAMSSCSTATPAAVDPITSLANAKSTAQAADLNAKLANEKADEEKANLISTLISLEVISSTEIPTVSEPTPSPTETKIEEAAIPAIESQPQPVGQTVSSTIVFSPLIGWTNWSKLDAKAPTNSQFMDDHNLKDNQIQKYDVPSNIWEPAIYVVELTPDLYGKLSIPLREGYAYTVALCDGTVQTFWGGDPSVESVCVQWGFTARWVKTYVNTTAGQWLSITDPTEWVVRENRFGRYLRSENSGLPNLPYFNRWGPYLTLAGNVLDWTPPALDAVSPRDFRDAATMLGGRAVQSEWITNGTNWAWKYGPKVSGSGDYCPIDMPCWQTVYIPDFSTGYVELWLSAGTIGPDGNRVTKNGPYKFPAGTLAILVDGKHNVDEFSYHPFGK